MKKIYSILAIAAAVAISASAGEFTLQKSISSKKSFSITPTESLSIQKADCNSALSISKVAAKASESQSIEGDWTFVLGDYYRGNNSQGPITVPFTATLSEGMVIFQPSDNGYLPMAANYNETSGELTFKKVLLGQVQVQTSASSTATYYCRQEPFIYNYTAQDLDFQDITGKYDAQKNTITLGEDNGIAWAAYTDEACTDFGGYLIIYDIIGAEAQKVATLVPMGTGTLIENFMSSLFGETNQNPYTVELFYDENDPSTIIVKNPLKQFYAALKLTKESPNMVLNIADFSNVLIPLCLTGVGNETDGEYGYFSESWYDANYPDENAPFDESLRIKLTIDGTTAKIEMPAKSIFVMGTETGTGGASTLASSLTFDASKLPSDVTGAINTVVADSDANAHVEYFNLQGVRVANPEAGQFVIKRQGSTVTKLIAR